MPKGSRITLSCEGKILNLYRKASDEIEPCINISLR